MFPRLVAAPARRAIRTHGPSGRPPLDETSLILLPALRSVVNNDIFPHVASGFSDTVDAMREQTVKSMLHLAPKLSPASFDNVLLKHFAKLQTDENAGIRANTTTCLGMIAQHLPPASRERVLIPAFLRATRDPFKHSRKAAMSALTATLKFYPADEVARKLAPSICPMMMDPEKEVRDPAFALLAAIMEHLQAVSDGTVPSTAAVDGDQAGTAAAASWGSWAGSAVSGMAKAGSALSTVSSKVTFAASLAMRVPLYPGWPLSRRAIRPHPCPRSRLCSSDALQVWLWPDAVCRCHIPSHPLLW